MQYQWVVKMPKKSAINTIWCARTCKIARAHDSESKMMLPHAQKALETLAHLFRASVLILRA
jgi:hypothetical protein